LNPLHLYCRLRDCGVGDEKARRAAAWWERATARLLYEGQTMDSKFFLASKRVQGALAAILGLVLARYGVDMGETETLKVAGDILVVAGFLWHLVGQATAKKRLRLRPKSKTALLLLLLPILALFAIPALAEDDAPAYRVLFTSLSVTKHRGPGSYEDFHPGLGLELQVSPDKESAWNFAAGGHYMHADSHGLPMWWAGVTPSYTLGDRAGWWMEPGVTAGLIRKAGLYGNEPGPLVLPRLAVGYGPVGCDFSYIPGTPLTNNVSIALFMLRLRFDLP
jgi:hypothetical protein